VGDELTGIRRFRQHVMWYAHGLTGAASFRNNVTRIDTLEPLLESCEAFFLGAERDALVGEDVEYDVQAALG
jgi:tRNA-dihydrouridine synthase